MLFDPPPSSRLAVLQAAVWAPRAVSTVGLALGPVQLVEEKNTIGPEAEAVEGPSEIGLVMQSSAGQSLHGQWHRFGWCEGIERACDLE